MKGQIFIAEAEEFHHNCGTGYLLGAHTIGTGTVTLYFQITHGKFVLMA